MKKTIALLLTLAFVFCLCACGKATNATHVAETPTVQNSQTTNDNDVIKSQIVLLFNSICMLKTNPDYSKYWYTICDLDHNGRLEVIAAVTEGSGSYTSAFIYEVTPDYTTLGTVKIGLKEGEFLPEIIKNSVDTYRVSDGTYNYIYFDSTNIDTENACQTIEAISLKNGNLSVTPLGYVSIGYNNDEVVYSFKDVNGTALANQEAYLALAPAAFPGTTATKTSFDWFALSDIFSTERLAKSYSVFSGESQLDVDPVITPAPNFTPSPTPTPTPTPAPKDPVVTKNPTSESVYVGGSCQFVAKATDASSMRWKLMDAAGNVYDVASSPYKGQLGVSGASSTCLTLSNIPLGMNGYTAYAEFYGISTVKSTRATINVSPVPSATVSASHATGTIFSQLYNNVALYSSNGANIHYECIKSGDSGPYASGEVANGGSINIAGIEGQKISVEVYCSVVGSDKTCYFSYYIDLTPATTEWSENGTVIGDNFTEVYIQTNSGVHYIDKMDCMFGGTGFYSIGDTATVTFRNGQVLIATIMCTGTEPFE